MHRIEVQSGTKSGTEEDRPRSIFATKELHSQPTIELDGEILWSGAAIECIWL